MEDNENYLKGSYGSLNRGEEPIIPEMSERPGWYDIPKNGGGDIDLAEY